MSNQGGKRVARGEGGVDDGETVFNFCQTQHSQDSPSDGELVRSRVCQEGSFVL